MDSSQTRAIRNYRSRLTKLGLVRYEVLGLPADRNLIRSLAGRLAKDDAEATELRSAVARIVAVQPSKRGGILAALRSSPLVDADLKLTRSREQGRTVEL